MPGQFTLIIRIGLLPTLWFRGSTAFERTWIQGFMAFQLVRRM
jgi:hypothetical protein